jgi:hypothetical protein
MTGMHGTRRMLPALFAADVVLVALGPARAASAEIQSRTPQFQNAETGPARSGHSGGTGWSEFYRSF